MITPRLYRINIKKSEREHILSDFYNFYRYISLILRKNTLKFTLIAAYIRVNLNFDNLQPRFFCIVYRIKSAAAVLPQIADENGRIIGHVSVARKHAVAVVFFGKNAFFVAISENVLVPLPVGRRKIIVLPFVRYARYELNAVFFFEF